MIKEVLKRLTTGVAIGGSITFIALTLMMINDIEVSVSVIWLNMLVGLLLGIYFALASVIFMHGKWSELKKTVIHLGSSLTVYYSLALPIGWIPVTLFAIVVSLIIFIVIYAIYWTGFYFYYKKVTESLNNELPQ